jgi:hypothetical protein
MLGKQLETLESTTTSCSSCSVWLSLQKESTSAQSSHTNPQEKNKEKKKKKKRARMSGSDAREIQVRTITGESTTVWVPTNSTIEELKLLLKQSFLPASNSPNFHLFFKARPIIVSLYCNFNLSLPL